MQSNLRAFADWRFPVMLCGFIAAGYVTAAMNAGQHSRDLTVAFALVAVTCIVWLVLGRRKPPSPFSFGALVDLAASAGVALVAVHSLLEGSLLYAAFWAAILAVFLHRAAGAFVESPADSEASPS